MNKHVANEERNITYAYKTVTSSSYTSARGRRYGFPNVPLRGSMCHESSMSRYTLFSQKAETTKCVP